MIGRDDGKNIRRKDRMRRDGDKERNDTICYTRIITSDISDISDISVTSVTSVISAHQRHQCISATVTSVTSAH